MTALAHLLGVVSGLVRLPPRIHDALLGLPSALRGLLGALHLHVYRVPAAGFGSADEATPRGAIPRCTAFLRADDGPRTRDLWLGKPPLYQLSYVRAPRDSSVGRAMRRAAQA